MSKLPLKDTNVQYRGDLGQKYTRISTTLILVGAIVFNFLILLPEVSIKAPPLNDHALHLPLVARVIEAFSQGEDPTDPWIPNFVLGYPLFHHYQHLPHLLTALLYKSLGESLSLPALFNLLNYVLLSTFPLSIYWTGRRLGFTALPSAVGGLVASLLSTNGLYGLDWFSYVWRGYGMFTQLWGMWLMGPAIAGLYTTMRDGRAYAGTVTLLSATLMSHLVLGYFTLLSGVLFVVLEGRHDTRICLKRLGLILLLVVAVTAYFLLPFFQDRTYMNRSVWEDPDKYNAYGWEWTLKALMRGELLDFGRFPSLSLLLVLGIVICFIRWRQSPRYRLLVIFFVFWFFLYFGRPTWGVLLKLLPMSDDLHFHRLIAVVHLGAVGLIGAGLVSLWEIALLGYKRWKLIAVSIMTAVLLIPVYVERITFMSTNAMWKRDSAAAFVEDNGALGSLLGSLHERPAGRIYAGRSANWGRTYTIGSVPVYALLASNGFDSMGHLYHALSLNADIEGYLDENRPANFNLFNLRYIIAPEGHPFPSFARDVSTYGRHRLYEVQTSGYFDLVDSNFTLSGDHADWFEMTRDWIQSDWVEAKQHPVINFGSPFITPTFESESDMQEIQLAEFPDGLADIILPEQEVCGKILNESIGGNKYVVEFTNDRTCWLMLKATYHPGWQATLDGQPVSTAMLAPSFVGVPVRPGNHSAQLRYETGALRRWLRIAGLLTLVLVALAERMREWWSKQVKRLEVLLVPFASILLFFKRVDGNLIQRLLNKLRTHFPYLGWLVLMTLLAGLPLFQFKIMDGHDALAYLPRVVEFYEGLKSGQLYPRWAPDLGAGFGEPTFIFNAPLFYYCVSFFHTLGFTVVAAQNVSLFVLLCIASFGMYLLAGEIFGPRGGLVAAVAYLFSPYLLVTLYVRYALADFSALAFIPLAFWGLYRFLLDGRYHFLLIGSSFLALLILSSNSVSLLTFPFLVLLVGWLTYKDWHAGKTNGRVLNKLRRGILSLGLGLGLSAFFWIPALLEQGFVHISRRTGGYLDFRNHFVYLHQFVFSRWGYGLSMPGSRDEMSFAIGWVHLLCLGAVIWYLRSHQKPGNQGKDLVVFFLGVFFLAMFFSSHGSIFIWEKITLLHPLQFPWRFLSLIAVSTAFLCGTPFLIIPSKHEKQANLLMICIITGLFILGLPHAQPGGFLDVSDMDYSPEVIASEGIHSTARQFEPIWVQQLPEEPAPESRLWVVDGQVRIKETRLRAEHQIWLLENEELAHLRLATFYYPGWRLRVDGQSHPFSILNPYGLMDFLLEPGQHVVELIFALTSLRQWAVVTAIAALALLLLKPLIQLIRIIWVNLQQATKALSTWTADKHRRLALLLSLVLPPLIIFLVYLPVLQNGFVWDDTIFLQAETLYRDPGRWQQALRQPFIFSPNYFRPLTILTFMVELRLGGLSPSHFHLTNLLLHTLNTFLISMLARQIWPTDLANNNNSHHFRGKWIAGTISGLLYGLHPTLIEGVAFISSRFDLLLTTLLLLGLLVDVKLRHHRLRPLVIAIIFLLAAMVKEMAVAFVLILPVWHMANLFSHNFNSKIHNDGRIRISSLYHYIKKTGNIDVYIALFISGLIYLSIRFASLGYLLVSLPDNSVITGGGLQHVLLVGRSLIEYITVILWPFTSLTPIHFTRLPVPVNDYTAWISLIAVLILMIVLVKWVQITPHSGWLTTAGIISLVPVLNILPLELGGGAFVAERFLTFPLIFFTLAFSSLLTHGLLGTAVSLTTNKRTIITFSALCIWWVTSAFVIRSTVPYWRSDLTLWTWTSKMASMSSTVLNNLALAFIQESGEYERGLETAQQAINIDPENSRAWDHAGLALFYMERYADAQTAFEQAVALSPQDALLWNNLAGALREQGKLDEAEKILLDQSLRLNPSLPMAHLNLGIVYMRAGRPDMASIHLIEARRFLPPDTIAQAEELLLQTKEPDRWLRMGDLMLARDDYAGALRSYEEAATLGAHPAEVALGQSAVFMEMEDFSQADLILKNALEYAAHDARIYNNLGVIARERNDIKTARTYFNRAIELAPDFDLPRYNLDALRDN